MIDPKLADEAKAIALLAFRNGPIEDIHAGKRCQTCAGDSTFSHITDAEMRLIMKNAVDHVYALLHARDNDPEKFAELVAFGKRYTYSWDEPTERP